MMPTAWGTKNGPYSLRLYSKYGETIEGFHQGDRLRITVDVDRHGKFNSLVHVMFGLLAKAINRGPATTSIDALKKWIKLKKGWYDVVEIGQPTIDGLTHAIDYHSTSFNKMGEEEFEQFAQDACELIRSEMAPWVSDSDEWAEVMQIIGKITKREAA